LLQSVTAAEFDLWAEFYRVYGFDVDRVEWASANAGAAAARSMGANIRPADLVPRFSTPHQGSSNAQIMAFFDGLAAKGKA
jgi:hypothetical protein